MIAEIQIQKNLNSKIKEFDFENVTFGKAFSDHMFIADYDGKEWGNLQIIPYSELAMSPAISAVHYGQSIFEGMKAYRNESGTPLLFRPLDNWKRLNYSARRMCMPEIPEDIFMQGLTELVKLDRDWIPTKGGSALYIRPVMFATDTFVGVKASEKYRFVIFCCPVNAYYNAPLRVMVPEHFVRACVGGVGDAKCSGNYAASMLAAKQASQKGYSQVLWLDAEKHEYLEETGTTNVFVRINDTVITPELDGTILAGITRDSAIQLLRDKGVKVEERKIGITEVIAAYKNGTLKEVFATGTAATVVPIELINYKDEDYQLGNTAEWELVNYLKGELEAIKSGKKSDTRNWILPVTA